ncbi:MAG: hypothetical protein ABIH38_04530 [Patescibacteria group bacterium]
MKNIIKDPRIVSLRLSRKEIKILENFERQWNKILKEIILLRFKGKYRKSIPENQMPKILENLTISLFKKTKNKLVLINLAGPSGVGKGTIGERLEKKGIVRFARTTTRSRRPAEKNGVDYIFLNNDQFNNQKKRGKFLSAFATYGEWRGIERKNFWHLIKKKKMFYIDGCAVTSRDVSRALKEKDLSYLSIFILPPSFEELIIRLLSRTTQEREKKVVNTKILRRIRNALAHLKQSSIVWRGNNLIHVYVLNDKVGRATNKIFKLIKN